MEVISNLSLHGPYQQKLNKAPAFRSDYKKSAYNIVWKDKFDLPDLGLYEVLVVPAKKLRANSEEIYGPSVSCSPVVNTYYKVIIFIYTL